MSNIAPLSNTEAFNVQDGVAHDVREDGRGRMQQRRAHFRVLQSTPSSRVEADVCGTTVVASASPSVVEVGEERPHGQLHISVDMAPAVVDLYGATLGGRQRSYWRSYCAYVAQTIRQTFGAESVEVQEVEGVATAQLAGADAEEEEEGDYGAEAVPAAAAAPRGSVLALEQLYIGKGYAFSIDVDVHVLQAVGGNVAGCISQAVHTALAAVQLPAVTLHEGAGGVAAEVDADRPYGRPVDWSRLPVLCVVLLSPTRHYAIDPTALEERALPQQAHIAANAQGQISYSVLRCHPSRRGNYDYLDVGNKGGRGTPAQVSLSDWLTVVNSAVHTCQTIIADCREALHQTA